MLAGLRVLDLGRYIAAPYCAAILADYGAEVIRIESPGGADDREQGPIAPSGDNFRFLMLGRNKKGLSLDILHQRGREVFLELVRASDVLVENFSPESKVRLGLTYEQLRETNPRIVATSVSAYGTSGPNRDRVGFDAIVQAESGSMSINGHPGTPPVRAQVPWIDFGAGLHAAMGTIMALWHRERTGRGQQVDVALSDTAFSFLGFMGSMAEFDVLGERRAQLANRGYYYFCDLFAAADGDVMVASLSNVIWRRLCTLIERSDLRAAPGLEDDAARYRRHDELRAAVQEWIGPRTVAEVTAAMRKARVPCGPVRSIADAMMDPIVEARGLTTRMEARSGGPMVPHPHVALRMSDVPSTIRSPAPLVGEHNDEILQGVVGLSPDEISSLRAEGVI